LQTLGRRIFPGGGREPKARDARLGQLDVAAPFGRIRGRFTVGERVRGRRERTSQGARAGLLRSQDRRSSQRKASWFLGDPRPNPTMVAWEPGRAGIGFAMNVAKRIREERAELSEERSEPHPRCDRGRQRSVRSGEASSADGRRRSAAAGVAPRCGHHAAPAGAG
jgi:hypothetical protein